MIQEIGDWNCFDTTSDVWFSELKVGITYRLNLDCYWYDGLNHQYKEKKENVRIVANTYGAWKLNNGRNIPSGVRILLYLWRSFFDKWAKADKKGISKDTAVYIELKKSTNKVWNIIKIEQYKLGHPDEI